LVASILGCARDRNAATITRAHKAALFTAIIAARSLKGLGVITFVANGAKKGLLDLDGFLGE
jgi:hypothetical protein